MAKRLALHAICPYFAMFPEKFVREHVEEWSKASDWIFDPFCGRGTTLLESLLAGRQAAGADINPVAYCISRAKAEPPSLDAVLARISRIESQYNKSSKVRWEAERKFLSPFFRRGFYATTLRELLFLRASLNWKRNRLDRFVAALVLGSLHGEMDRSQAYFSNQMPRTICLKPDYSLRYWRKHGLFPKKREVFKMLREKARYRLKDLPEGISGTVRMTDARRASSRFPDLRKKVKLVITSPPYLNVTRYEEDQWLRLWFLGGEPRPTYGQVSKDDRHEVADRYWLFLQECWQGLAPMMKPSAKLVIRIGAIGLDEKEMTNRLSESVKKAFSGAKLLRPPSRSEIVGRQSNHFVPPEKGCRYEMDYIFAL